MAFVDIEQFIMNIERYPILWDLGHEEYKNVKKKAKIWKMLSVRFDISVVHAKTKWKRLRDSYVRATTRRPSGENGQTYSSGWKYEKVMSFLEGAVRSSKRKNTNSNDNEKNTFVKENPESVLDTLESSDLFNELQGGKLEDNFPCMQSNASLSASESSSSMPQERNEQEKLDAIGEQLLVAIKNVQEFCKRKYEEKSSTEDDEDNLFSRCLAVKLKKLPLATKNRVKLDIFKLVCDEEEKLNLE